MQKIISIEILIFHQWTTRTHPLGHILIAIIIVICVKIISQRHVHRVNSFGFKYQDLLITQLVFCFGQTRKQY